MSMFVDKLKVQILLLYVLIKRVIKSGRRDF